MKSFGVMFHHFHDRNKYLVSQGSIDYNTFNQMLCYLKDCYNLLDAEDYYQRAVKQQLGDHDICITFDDGLACQYEIAFPVLKKFDIKAFWFIYSSPLAGCMEKLEIFRHFRFYCFETIEQFYEVYFSFIDSMASDLGAYIQTKLGDFDPNQYLLGFNFYTDQDKKFRFIRDVVLNKQQYDAIMEDMMKLYQYDPNAHKENLWIKKEHIKTLSESGQVIGLHSHSHPTALHTYTYENQWEEYKKNKEILEKIIQKPIKTASYPCNSFSKDTDLIMNALGIQLGFNAKIDDENLNTLHIQREDHINIVKEMLTNESYSLYK